MLPSGHDPLVSSPGVSSYQRHEGLAAGFHPDILAAPTSLRRGHAGMSASVDSAPPCTGWNPHRVESVVAGTPGFAPLVSEFNRVLEAWQASGANVGGKTRTGDPSSRVLDREAFLGARNRKAPLVRRPRRNVGWSHIPVQAVPI